MTATTTAKTIRLSNGDKVRFNIATRDGRDYLWTFQLFHLYQHLLDEVAEGGHMYKQWLDSGLYLDDFVSKLWTEEFEQFGPDCAISLRPETAVLALYSDEQKAAMKAEREAQPVLFEESRIEVRGTLYRVVRVTRDGVKLAAI